MSAFKIPQLLLALSLTVAFGAFGVHESVAVTPESALTLSGDDEVPPVKTNASGSGSISVATDKAVSGSVTTTGIAATAAHMHVYPSGSNGPVIIPLAEKGDNELTVRLGP